MAFFKYFASSCCLRDSTGLPAAEIVEEGSDSGLDLYIEREHSPTGGPKSSFRWTKRLKLAAFDKQVAPQHNFKHRILVSQVVFQSRWSDFNSADLISLDSEMLRVISSKRSEPAVSGRCRITEAISPEVATEGILRAREDEAIAKQTSQKYSFWGLVLTGEKQSAIYI